MWPDTVITKLGLGPHREPRRALDLDFCEGCGLCAEPCPAGAVAVIPESGEE